MFERKKYHVTYFEVKNKSITSQCFAEKQKCHVSTENSCVAVARPGKDECEYHVWRFNVLLKVKLGKQTKYIKHLTLN